MFLIQQKVTVGGFKRWGVWGCSQARLLVKCTRKLITRGTRRTDPEVAYWEGDPNMVPTIPGSGKRYGWSGSGAVQPQTGWERSD